MSTATLEDLLEAALPAISARESNKKAAAAAGTGTVTPTRQHSAPLAPSQYHQPPHHEPADGSNSSAGGAAAVPTMSDKSQYSPEAHSNDLGAADVTVAGPTIAAMDAVPTMETAAAAVAAAAGDGSGGARARRGGRGAVVSRAGAADDHGGHRQASAGSPPNDGPRPGHDTRGSGGGKASRLVSVRRGVRAYEAAPYVPAPAAPRHTAGSDLSATTNATSAPTTVKGSGGGSASATSKGPPKQAKQAKQQQNKPGKDSVTTTDSEAALADLEALEALEKASGGELTSELKRKRRRIKNRIAAQHRCGLRGRWGLGWNS